MIKITGIYKSNIYKYCFYLYVCVCVVRYRRAVSVVIHIDNSFASHLIEIEIEKVRKNTGDVVFKMTLTSRCHSGSNLNIIHDDLLVILMLRIIQESLVTAMAVVLILGEGVEVGWQLVTYKVN